MKTPFTLLAVLLLVTGIQAQSPEKFSYQAVLRDADGKLLQEKPIGVRISVLMGAPDGEVVYTETHQATTNINGLITLEVGSGITSDDFSAIVWSDTLYYLKTETDPAGGTNYSLTSTSQFLSVPYSLFAAKAGGGWPVQYQQVLTETQVWTVPESITKINVELWGASGGGGGSGAYSYSYSYNLNNGGCGGGGGYIRQELEVTPNQEFTVVIGAPGNAGNNASQNLYGYWTGDSDGGYGGSSWFGDLKAAGGSGGLRGSAAPYTIHGNPGTDNVGAITGYSDEPCVGILNVFEGLERSYINNRVLTSRPGKGGSIITSYSINKPPTAGEGGCAIITFFE